MQLIGALMWNKDFIYGYTYGMGKITFLLPDNIVYNKWVFP